MKLMTLVLMCLIAITTQASGSREYFLSADKLTQLREIQPSASFSKLHYLGSTAQWHILGQTLTSTEGGRPFDNTFAYKLLKKHIQIENGWSLNLASKQYWLHVKSCPSVNLSNTPSKHIVKNSQLAKQYCILATQSVKARR
jgi:hypothetical protein